jgi:acetolactate synthase-1/2/3 large subunit
MIRWMQANMSVGDWSLTYGNPDFVRYAESYGAHGHRVGSAAELGPRLAHCLATEGFHPIDCPADYSEDAHCHPVKRRHPQPREQAPKRRTALP